MNYIVNAYNYIKLRIEVTLYNLFQDDGRRHHGDFKDKL
jgi:hypothetical protein